MAVVRGQTIVLPEVVGRAVELIGAGLGDDVDEPAARTAEFGVSPIGDYHEVLHRVEVESERRPLATPLFAEERVVEVGAVHRDVVVNPSLSANADLVAVRALHDGHVGRERREVEDVATVVRQTLDHFGAEPRLLPPTGLRPPSARRRRQCSCRSLTA